MPCKKIESVLLKSKNKFISKRSIGISVITTYIIFVLVIIIIKNLLQLRKEYLLWYEACKC